MTDWEKVIKGLLCIKGDYILCASCKYANADGYGRGDRCKRQCASDAITLLKEQEAVVRCKDCRHLFDAEHNDNCCDVLMEKAGWGVEITVNPDWFCADGERKQ